MSSPPSRNSYLEYKRNTAQLIRWIVTTASRVSQKQELSTSGPSASSVPKKPDNGRLQAGKIDSPEITIASLVSYSQLISSSAKSVPATVYNLFSTVIRARMAAYQFWHSTYAMDLDEDVKKSNEAHKAFINALQAAYETLGGKEWERRQAEERESRPKDQGDEVEEPFANRFEGLEIDGLSQDEGTEDTTEKTEGVPRQKAQRKNKKGKGKKKPTAPAPKPQDWPLEDFKIKDDPGAETEAVFAAFCFLQDMMKLRRYVSDLWKQVANEQLHAAIAGVLSNVAVARVKQLQYDATADFPQFSNFETILDTLCRGDLESAAGKLKVVTSGPLGNMETTTLDFREYFSVYAHDDLVNFITDYRKNRSGKPSASYASLKWDPNVKLSQLDAKKRQKWRSDYSILWLYDIVNSYASSILTGIPLGSGVNVETWDWGMEHMSRKTRRMLWGPVEFVSEVTALAMKRIDTLPAKFIKPHLVFQTQIMLDSMTTFKGWNFDVTTGPFIGPEAPWSRAYDEIEAFHKNFINGAEGLIREYEADQKRRRDPRRHQYPLEEIPKTVTEIQLVLGDSMLSRAKGAPLSRFEYIDRKGMWLYNPWLCGTGLAEALGFVFEFGITAWDKSGAPLCIFHLYNMLLANGHLPGGKLNILEDLLSVFESQVFRGGKRPTRSGDFFQSWMVAAGIKAQVLANPHKKRMNRGGNILDSGERMASMYRRAEVRCFHEKSILRYLQEADWIPEKLPKEKIPSLSSSTAILEMKKKEQQKLITAMKKSGIVPTESDVMTTTPDMTDDDLLFALRKVLVKDVTGEVPFAALNLLPLLCYIMQNFEKLDDATKGFERPLGPPVGPDTAHNSVTKLAMDLDIARQKLEGNPVLRKMGEVMEELVRGVELGDFTFWDYVVDTDTEGEGGEELYGEEMVVGGEGILVHGMELF